MIAGYLRNSFRRDGTREGASIERQMEVVQDFITENKVLGDVTWFTDDGISGARNAKMLSLHDVIRQVQERNIKILLVERLDRLGRNASEVTKLMKLIADFGVELYSVKEGHISPVIGAILAGFAEAELDKLSFRMQESRLRSFAMGRAMGIPKLGYKIDENDRYQIDPETQPQVEMIFNLYGSGKAGVDTICSIMDLLFPYRPESDGAWKRNKIIGRRHVLDGQVFRLGGILNDRTYIGERMTGRLHITSTDEGKRSTQVMKPETWSKSHHPAIIDRTSWDAVQARLEHLENEPSGGHQHLNRYVFDDVLHCAVCGEPFVGIGGATVKNRPWRRTARQMCRGAFRGRCGNERTVDMACCQVLILSVLDEELSECRNDASEEMNRSQSTSKADLLRQMGRLSLSLRREMNEYERTLIEQKREELRALTNDDAATKVEELDTVLDAVSLLLTEFPRDVQTADGEVQRAAKIVRASVSKCFISDEGHHCFGFRLETLRRAYVGTFRIEFRSLLPAMHVVFDHMRATDLPMTTAEAKSLVMRSGFERKHGLRSLTRLEREDLVEHRQGRWFLTGRSPLMIGGLSAIMALQVRSETLV